MDEDVTDAVVLLTRPVVYVEPDEVTEENVGFEDETAEYVLAQVEHDYDEVEVVEQEEIDIDSLDPLEEVVLLDTHLVNTGMIELPEVA